MIQSSNKYLLEPQNSLESEMDLPFSLTAGSYNAEVADEKNLLL
jgi:hypothetical protein